MDCLTDGGQTRMPKFLTDPQGRRHEIREGETPQTAYQRLQAAPKFLTDPQGRRHEIREGETPQTAYQRLQQAAPPPAAPQGSFPSIPGSRVNPAQGTPAGYLTGGGQGHALPRGSASPGERPETDTITRMAIEALAGIGATAAAPIAGPALGLALGASKLRHIPGIARAVQAAGRLPNTVKNALQGGIEGAAVSAPFAREGEGAEAGAVGGLVGGVAGAAVPAAINLAAGLGRGARRMFDPKYVAAARAANTPPTAGSILDDPAAIAADINPNLAAEVAENAPVDVQEALFTGQGSIIGGRQAAAGKRLAGAAEEALPSPQRGGLDDITALREAEEFKLYGKAYEQPVPEAANRAFNAHRGKDDFIDAQKLAARAMRNLHGPDVNPGVNTVESMHRTLEALTDKYNKLVKNEQGGLAHTVGKIRNSIRDAMEKNIPGFKSAQAYAKGTFDRQEAFKEGQKFFQGEVKPGTFRTASYLKNYVKSLADDPEQLDFYRRGVIESMVKGVDASNIDDNIVKMFNNRGTRSKLEAVLPKGVYNTFLDFVQKENVFSKTFKATRPKVSAGAAGKSGGDDSLQIIGNIIRAGAWNSPFAQSSLGQNLLRRLSGLGDDKVYRELVPLLTGRTIPEPVKEFGVKRTLGVGTFPALFNPRDHSE